MANVTISSTEDESWYHKAASCLGEKSTEVLWIWKDGHTQALQLHCWPLQLKAPNLVWHLGQHNLPEKNAVLLTQVQTSINIRAFKII